MSAYTVTRNTLAVIGAATVAGVVFLIGQSIAADLRVQAMARRWRHMDAAYQIHRVDAGLATPDAATGAGDSTDRGRSASAPPPVAGPEDTGEWWSV